MEISIKWNVCRVCLVEERRNHAAKYTPIDTKISKQIHEIAGVQMDGNDNLPDKICRKCLVLLKYACHFSTICRNSDEYLQSIIRKTNSAASMLKMDKRKRSVELMHEIFDYESELPTINLLDEDQEHTTMDVDLKTNDEIISGSKVLAEKIGDGGEGNVYVTQLIKREKSQINYNSRIPSKKGLFDEQENLHHELIDEDYQDTELDNYDDKKEDYDQQNLEVHNKSICSMDGLGYTDDDADEEVAEGTSDVMYDQGEYNSNANQTCLTNNSKLRCNRNNVQTESAKDDEHNTETLEKSPDLFYVIKVEEPVVQMEDPEHSRNIDDHTNNECSVEVEEEDSVQLINDLSETDCREDGGGEENADENSETYKSILPLEEYLIDESDPETVVQQQECVEFNETIEQTRHISTTTIKITEREPPTPPNGSKRLSKDNYTFSCDVCGNNFTSRSLKNYHMRIHRNEKNFECELCFKRFTAACNLTAHMRIHTGEKPYECKYCFRRFTDRSTHIKHERIHTNEKPFQCNICGKSFSLSTTLRTHEKVHTNEKPFKCIPCNKSFKLPHQLKAHLLSNQHKNMLMSNDLETLD